jgi:hypothetical protein
MDIYQVASESRTFQSTPPHTVCSRICFSPHRSLLVKMPRYLLPSSTSDGHFVDGQDSASPCAGGVELHRKDSGDLIYVSRNCPFSTYNMSVLPGALHRQKYDPQQNSDVFTAPRPNYISSVNVYLSSANLIYLFAIMEKLSHDDNISEVRFQK